MNCIECPYIRSDGEKKVVPTDLVIAVDAAEFRLLPLLLFGFLIFTIEEWLMVFLTMSVSQIMETDARWRR